MDEYDKVKMRFPRGLHLLTLNVSYCFLNGMANPLVDWLAKKYSHGYVNGTDNHYATYNFPTGQG